MEKVVTAVVAMALCACSENIRQIPTPVQTPALVADVVDPISQTPDPIPAAPTPRLEYAVESAGRSYSFSEPAQQVFRHEVRSGDRICAAGTCEPSERSEIVAGLVSDSQSMITVDYGFTVEPGPPTTSGWLVIGQFSLRDLAKEFSPPIEIDLLPGDKMAVAVGWQRSYTSSLTPFWNATINGKAVSYGFAFKEDLPLVRGRTYQMRIEALLNPQNGILRVYRDGVRIVNYQGPLGFDLPTVWRSGVWRQPAPETIGVIYSGLKVTR